MIYKICSIKPKINLINRNCKLKNEIYIKIFYKYKLKIHF